MSTGRSERLALRLKFARPALIAVLAIDLVALAAFSVSVHEVTRTTTTPAATSSTPVQPVLPVPAPLPVVPVLQPAAPTLGDGIAVDEPTPSTPPPSATPTDGPDPTGPEVKIARCPIPIKEPTTSGGLQTLIGFAPAFGPFKAEAFAAASAYQPLLQLLGPILAKYPAIAPSIEPAMAPFLQAFAGLLDTVYAVIAPFYGPQRQAFLEAEGKLAAALAPYAQQLVASPLGGCVVELQAALLEDSKA